MFTSVSFIAILRHCNQAAHVLAAFAKEKVGVSVWFDECPPFLFSILYLMKLYLSFLIKKKKTSIPTTVNSPPLRWVGHVASLLAKIIPEYMLGTRITFCGK